MSWNVVKCHAFGFNSQRWLLFPQVYHSSQDSGGSIDEKEFVKTLYPDEYRMLHLRCTVYKEDSRGVKSDGFWIFLASIYSGWWFGTFSIFPYIGNVIIPIDFHIFQRGGPTTNQLFIWINTHQSSIRKVHGFPIWFSTAWCRSIQIHQWQVSKEKDIREDDIFHGRGADLVETVH